MNKATTSNRLGPALMGLALAAFYIGLLLHDGVEKVAAAYIILVGITTWIRDAETRRALAQQAGLFLVFAALPAVALLSWVANGMPETGVKMLGKYARFLLVVPIYAGLWRWLGDRLFWNALLCAGGALAIWNFVETAGWIDLCYTDHCSPDELNGALSRIQYGGLSFALAAMLLAGAPAYFQRSRTLGYGAALTASLVLFGAMGSGTRTLYLALLPTLVFWAGLVLWRGRGFRRQLAGVAAGVALALTLAWPVIRDRSENAAAEVAAFQQQDYARSQSIGGRLRWWRWSLKVIAQHPWLGVGPRQFRPAMQQLVADGELPSTSFPHHPHSEYLSVAATRGLLGLAALLAALALPALSFLRAYADSAAPTALAGLLMLAVIAQAALTESIFDLSSFTSFYVASIAALMALLQRERPMRDNHVQ